MSNKIQELHLSKELIDSLRFKQQKITFDDLSNELNIAVKNVGNASGSLYDDKELRSRIQVIERSFVDKDMANSDFAKKLEVLTKQETQDVVDKSVQALNNDLKNKIGKCLDGTKNKIVDEAMLTEELQYKINARYNNLYNNSSTSDGGSGAGIDENQFNVLRVAVNRNSESIDDLARRLNNTVSTNDKISLEMLSSEIKDMISTKTPNGTLTIAAFEPNTRRQLETAVNSDASALSSRVNKLETSVNTPNKQRRVMFSNTSSDTTSATGTPEWGDILNNCVVATRDQSLYKEIVAAAKSGKQIYTANNGISLNFDDVDDIIYIDVDAPLWCSRLDDAYIDITNKSPMKSFAGGFLYNKISNELYYMTNQEDPITIKGDAPSVFKECAIDGNKNYVFTISNPYSKISKVLLLDQDANSRTNKRWINSEGIITVAYSDSDITLFNDSDVQQKVRIYYR